MSHIPLLTFQIWSRTTQIFSKLKRISVTKKYWLVITRPKGFISLHFNCLPIDASHSGSLKDQLHHHGPGFDEVEEVESILMVVGEVGNEQLDFLKKQVNFKELVFHNLDFLNLHTAGKVDSKN